MIKNSNDIIASKTEEAEEIYAPEAKMVEAPDFHSGRAGSIPVWSTVMKDWYEGNKKTDVSGAGIKFNCTTITNTIAGRDFSRLGVLQR